MRIAFLIGGLALAVLVIVVVQYGPDWFSEPELPKDADVIVTPIEVEEDQTPVVSAPVALVEVLPEPVPEPELVLPPLDESDGFVLEQVAAFGLPEMWVNREGLMRRLAVVIDNASRGEYPRRQLGFMAPTGAFKVERRGGEILLDPVSYSRYDVYLDIIEKIEPELLARSLILFEPLLSDGLAELGNQHSTRAQLDVAIRQILDVPVVEGDVRLLRPKVLYEFADPMLEALSPLQKQVLRAGPQNVARLQRYLLRLRGALG